MLPDPFLAQGLSTDLPGGKINQQNFSCTKIHLLPLRNFVFQNSVLYKISYKKTDQRQNPSLIG
jgi:hypothetical protein